MDEEVRSRLEDIESRLRAIESALGESPRPRVEKGVSISEFLRTTKPSSDVEKTLALAYYLEKFEQKNSFNARDLENAFVRSKEPMPANINETVNKNIRKGFLMEVPSKKDGRKAWMVTNSGEVHVADLYRKT